MKKCADRYYSHLHTSQGYFLMFEPWTKAHKSNQLSGAKLPQGGSTAYKPHLAAECQTVHKGFHPKTIQ